MISLVQTKDLTCEVPVRYNHHMSRAKASTFCAKHNESRVIEGDGVRGTRNRCRSCVRESCLRSRRRNPKYGMVRSARNRADAKGLPFNITEDDIIIPQHCPVLGCELEFGDSPHHDRAPSLDRLKPELGYVSGNVRVISLRANRLKSDGSVAEHELLLTWMRQFCS